MDLIKTLNYYKGKRVYVTGHTGFKGSWLSYILDLIGAQVTGYSLEPNTEPSLFESLSFSNKFNSVTGDIRNKESFKRSIQKSNPEYIFHLAAQPLVLASYANPKETFDINFTGTLNLLEILRELNLPVQVVFVTTDKVYENLEFDMPFHETDKLGGKDPYSASKSASELLISSYNNSYFKDFKITNISTARAGNVIGGGDWSKNRLIPDIIRANQQNKTLIIRNPKATRPWQHVLEPIFGYLMLGIMLKKSPGEYSTSWNFGPEQEDTESVENIIKFSKDSGIICDILHQVSSHKEAQSLRLNTSKSKIKLNWSPKWTCKVAITNTMNWYVNYYKKNSANQLIQNDLKKYINEQ